jgi:hypothetical protein
MRVSKSYIHFTFGFDGVLENGVLRTISGPKRKEVQEGEENTIRRSSKICTPRQIVLG